MPKYISFQNGISLRKAVSQAGGFTPFSNKKNPLLNIKMAILKALKVFSFLNFIQKLNLVQKYLFQKNQRKQQLVVS